MVLHVWCLFVDDRYVIYLVSVDADIDFSNTKFWLPSSFLVMPGM